MTVPLTYGLLAAFVAAPAYWLLVPVRARRPVVTVLSLVVLGCLDWRLPLLVGAATVLVIGVAGLLPRLPAGPARAVAAGAALALVATFFVLHKAGQGGVGAALGSQGGLAFLGASYLALKVAGAIVEASRGGLGRPSLADLIGWFAFLPTYPAGPIETLAHFRDQRPQPSTARTLAGCERILFGAVKALVAAHYLGVWADGVLAAPASSGRPLLLLALYAQSLRFYFDFAGYSDIAIGLAALYGFEILENFDAPLVQRNYVLLWQRWHMTLTGWLRTYLFVPSARRLMRRAGPEHPVLPVVVAQVLTMTACGLWHGLTWGFALWGLLQAVGLIWIGVVARPLGARLPAALVAWWRRSPVAHAMSVAITFTAFSLTIVFVLTDLPGALRVLARLL